MLSPRMQREVDSLVFRETKDQLRLRKDFSPCITPRTQRSVAQRARTSFVPGMQVNVALTDRWTTDHHSKPAAERPLSQWWPGSTPQSSEKVASTATPRPENKFSSSPKDELMAAGLPRKGPPVWPQWNAPPPPDYHRPHVAEQQPEVKRDMCTPVQGGQLASVRQRTVQQPDVLMISNARVMQPGQQSSLHLSSPTQSPRAPPTPYFGMPSGEIVRRQAMRVIISRQSILPRTPASAD